MVHVQVWLRSPFSLPRAMHLKPNVEPKTTATKTEIRYEQMRMAAHTMTRHEPGKEHLDGPLCERIQKSLEADQQDST